MQPIFWQLGRPISVWTEGSPEFFHSEIVATIKAKQQNKTGEELQIIAEYKVSLSLDPTVQYKQC